MGKIQIQILNSGKELRGKRKRKRTWRCQTCQIPLPQWGFYCCDCGTSVQEQRSYRVVTTGQCSGACREKVMEYGEQAIQDNLPRICGIHFPLNYKCRCCSRPFSSGERALGCSSCDLEMCRRCVLSILPWNFSKILRVYSRFRTLFPFWQQSNIQRKRVFFFLRDIPKRLRCKDGTGCFVGSNSLPSFPKKSKKFENLVKM